MKTKTDQSKTNPAPRPTYKPNLTGVTIGVDMGDRNHAICATDAAGETTEL